MTFSCKAHWAFIVQAHLGDEYLLLAHQHTGADGTSLILLAKTSHVRKISNIRVSTPSPKLAPSAQLNDGIHQIAYAEEVRARDPVYDKKAAFAVKERLTPFMSKLSVGWRKDKEKCIAPPLAHNRHTMLTNKQDGRPRATNRLNHGQRRILSTTNCSWHYRRGAPCGP